MYNSKKIKFSFWDTAGQEIFNALNTIYYQGAVGGLIVYDVSNFDTFQKVQKWVNELQEIVGKDISLVVAGNKYDLIQSKEELNKQREVVDAYCQQEKVTHFYTSAKSGDGLNETFDFIIKEILSKQKDNTKGKKKGGLVLENADKTKEKKKCC